MKLDPRDQFGREAEKYLTSAVHADASALAELVALVSPQGGLVVDVGTGAGHMAFAVAPYVDQVVATDPTQAMLDVTSAEASRRGMTNLSTRLAFAEELPFGDGSVDGITCRVAAHHFRSVETFLDEVSRCLRPGGWFLLVDTVSPEDDAAADVLNEYEAIRDPSHGRNLKISEWETLVESRGFTIKAKQERYKELVFSDWTERMSVSGPDTQILKAMLESSSGALREYLQPGENSFSLLELTLLAEKPI